MKPLLPALRPARLALAALGCAAALAAAPAAAQSTVPRLRATGTVVVAYRPDALPFSYLDAERQPIGFGIDVCREVIARLRSDLRLPGLRVDYLPVTAANRIEAIRDARADLECGLTVDNPERRKAVGFALPYFFAGPRILTRADAGIRDFVDLAGKRIVVPRGANALPILRTRIQQGILSRAVVVEVSTNDEAFELLEKGGAAAFVTTDNLLHAYRATAAQPTRWIVTGAPLLVEPVAIMLRRNDPEFKALVDRALASLMLDGAMARLYERWFESPIPPKGVVLGIRPSNVLREQWRWPTDPAPTGP